MKRPGAIALALYALLCLGLIFGLPLNEYEWMLDDPAARAEGMTFCELPLDDGIDGRVLSLIAMLPLLGAGAVLSLRRRRIHASAWVALGLALAWGWRFFIHYPSCAG